MPFAAYRLCVSGGAEAEHLARNVAPHCGTGLLRKRFATITGEPWAYRNRVQLHFKAGTCGFHKAESHAIQGISHCDIAAPLLNEAIAKIQPAVKKQEWPDFLRSLELFTNGTDIQVNVLETNRPVAARFFTWLKEMVPAIAAGDIVYEAAGERFRIGGGSFFQTNRFLVDALVNEVIGDESGEDAVDLYAGVGLFTLPMAKRFTGWRRWNAGPRRFTICSSMPRQPAYQILRRNGRQPKSFYVACRRGPVGWWPIHRAPV